MKMIKLPDEGKPVYINADRIECVREDYKGDCIIQTLANQYDEQNFYTVKSMAADEFVKRYLNDE